MTQVEVWPDLSSWSMLGVTTTRCPISASFIAVWAAVFRQRHCCTAWQLLPGATSMRTPPICSFILPLLKTSSLPSWSHTLALRCRTIQFHPQLNQAFMMADFVTKGGTGLGRCILEAFTLFQTRLCIAIWAGKLASCSKFILEAGYASSCTLPSGRFWSERAGWCSGGGSRPNFRRRSRGSVLISLAGEGRTDGSWNSIPWRGSLSSSERKSRGSAALNSSSYSRHPQFLSRLYCMLVLGSLLVLY